MRRLDVVIIRLVKRVRVLLATPLLIRAKQRVISNPQSAAAHMELGRAYHIAGQTIAGIAQFRSSLCIDGELEEARDRLAKAYEQEGLPRYAIRESEEPAAGDLLTEQAAIRDDGWADIADSELVESRVPPRLEHVHPDRFMRFRTLQKAIERIANGDRLKVIDIGGGDGLFSLFIPRHRYLLIDPMTNGISGGALPFDENSFDVAIACHTLEHVPPSKRLKFVSEMTRVAERQSLVLGPMGETESDQKIDQLFWQITRAEWAREHMKFGLPTIEEFELIAQQQRLSVLVSASGCRGTVFWSAFAEYFSHVARMDKEYAQATQFFNRHYSTSICQEFPNDYLVEISAELQ